MTTGVVFDIKRFSVHDGPGIRTTVFLKGCPLTCWWCHNPEGQGRRPELVLRPERCIGCRACLDVCERDAIVVRDDVIVTVRERCEMCGACADVCYPAAREMVGSRMSVSEVVAEVERDRAFYEESGGGVTLSGGEPLSQPVFLRELLAALEAAGLHAALDTCGYAPWATLDEVREDVDLFLYDVKLMDAARHRQFTGVSNVTILDNLRKLCHHGHRVIVRIPVIPGINDDWENLEAIGTLAAALPSVERVDLLSYHRIGRHKYRQLGRECRMPDVYQPPPEVLFQVARRMRQLGLAVDVE